MSEIINNFKNKFKLSLNPQQEKALARTKGQTLLLAVPGSGKTTVIICRIGYLIWVEKIPPEAILTLTFSRMGAYDLKVRYKKIFGGKIAEGLEFSTIHSFSLSVIRHYERSHRRKAFSVLSHNTSIIKDLYRSIFEAYPGEIELGDIAQRISYCKNMLLTHKEIALLPKMEIDFLKIFKAYEEYKQENSLMDFDDILKYAWVLMNKHPEILFFFREKYKYINLDEAQDTSKIQFRLLELLAGKDGNLFMVGDEDQSIYGFRGAFPESLLKFNETWPRGEVLLMETNYRSTGQIVEKANAFIKLNKAERYLKEMKTPNEQGIPIIREWVKTNEGQYKLIIEAIKREGKEIAVLYRNNESAIPLVDLLERENLSYRIKEHNPLFFSHFILNDFKLFYEFSCRPWDYELFTKISYKMDLALPRDIIFELGKKLNPNQEIFDGLAKILGEKSWQVRRVKDLKSGFKKLNYTSPDKGIPMILEDLGYKSYLNFRIDSGQSEEGIEQKLAVLRTLGNRAKSFPEFFENLEALELKLRETQIKKNQHNRVTLSTLHSSKGLEFEKVFIIDAVEGQFPSKVAMNDGNEKLYGEEARLFYVGATRAKKELIFINVRIGEKIGKPSHFISYLIDGIPKKPLKENQNKKSSKQSFGEKTKVGQFLKGLGKKTESFDESRYKKGSTVTHQRFGKGTILEIEGDIAKIAFETGVKKMNLGICIENGVLE